MAIAPPIRTRIDMLTTGVRTPVGIKVFGDDLARIEHLSIELEGLLRDVPGTRSTFAERQSGREYVDIVPDRAALARVGLLFLALRGWGQTWLVLLSVPFAVVGSIWLLSALNYNLSTAVWVGLIAVGGVSAQTVIVVIVYLDEALRSALERGVRCVEEVDAAVVEGAVRGMRPMLMTVATTVLGLLRRDPLTGIKVSAGVPASHGFRTSSVIAELHMPTVRMRIIGSETDANALITMLHGQKGVESIEEVADLMPHMDDPDSSSAGLPDDIGPGIHAIEIDVSDRAMAKEIRELAGIGADLLETTIEFVDEF